MFLQYLTVFVFLTQANGRSCRPNELYTVYGYDYPCISKEICLQKNLVIYEETCLHQCPRSVSFFKPETRECLNKCPRDTVINGTTCLQVASYCAAQGKVVLDRRCVDSCPDDATLLRDHVCYDVCPDDTVGNGSHCIPRSECVTHSKVLDGTCVEDCPAEYLLTANSECVSSCPSGTAAEAKLCISEEECVREKRRVIYNTSCVETCPPESPLLHEGYCTSQCPLGKFVNGSNCESDSDCTGQGLVVFNSTCRTSCPDIAPLSLDEHCMSECPEDFVANDNLCIRNVECMLKYKVVFEGKCIDFCPESMPFIYAGSCKPRCPDETLIRFYQCINQRLCVNSGRFQYGNKCVNRCPKEAAYRMSINLYLDVQFPICVTKCPVETVRDETEGKCLSKIRCFKKNVDAVVFNNKCTDACPSTRKYNYSSVCYDTCPENAYAVGVQCLHSDRCTSSNQDSSRRVFHQGSCLDRCPPEARYEHKGQCVSLCPNTTLQLNIFCSTRNCDGSKVYDGEYCVTLSSCQDEGKLTFEGECIKYCPYGYFRYTTSCRRLPHIGLSLGITVSMCVLCIIPIAIVLYSPRRSRRCGSQFKKTDREEGAHCDYHLVEMVNRADDENIQEI